MRPAGIPKMSGILLRRIFVFLWVFHKLVITPLQVLEMVSQSCQLSRFRRTRRVTERVSAQNQIFFFAVRNWMCGVSACENMQKRVSYGETVRVGSSVARRNVPRMLDKSNIQLKS